MNFTYAQIGGILSSCCCLSASSFLELHLLEAWIVTQDELFNQAPWKLLSKHLSSRHMCIAGAHIGILQLKITALGLCISKQTADQLNRCIVKV